LQNPDEPIRFTRLGEQLAREAIRRRRWAIVREIDDIKWRLQSDTPTALVAQIEAIAEKLEATKKKGDAAADLAMRQSMAEWIQYEEEQNARARSQLPRLHQSQPEASSAELSIGALFNHVLEKKGIGLETWLRDHHFKRSSFMAWKAAGGKPVTGKVSVAKAREFEAAIRRDATEIGLT
jgi:hypothetical protein